MSLGRYLRNVLIGVDQGLNVLLGGWPDETLSSRFGRTRDENAIAELASRILDKIDKDHVHTSMERTEDGAAESHHLGDYQERQRLEGTALKFALMTDKELPDQIMELAERAARRQRLKEADRDKRHGR